METLTQELTFEEYNHRQKFETTEKGLLARATRLRPSSKFKFVGDNWQKIPYKGYAIVSMLDANFGNEAVSRQLVEMQRFLLEKVDAASEHFFPLPAASFHQTVANTLSSDRFKAHIEEKGLGSQYPQIIADAFAQIPASTAEEPIIMTLYGLGIFGSAMGILGTFEKLKDFHRLLAFRDHIYHNPTLNQLDIKRTRPFIGHLTMLYIDGVLNEKQKQQLVQACLKLNEDIQKLQPTFIIRQTQLRYYQELSYFQTQPHFPTFDFVSNTTSHS